MTLHRFGPFVLDVQNRRLFRRDEELALRSRAFDVLVALVERAGQLVTKNDLLDAVWQELAVEENNLQVQVSTLRKVLGTGWIVTVPGRGYRFETGAAEAAVATATVAAPAAAGIPAAVSPLVGRDAD